MPNDIAYEVEKLSDELGVDRKRSIGDVAKELKVKTHVIRFWEENFPQIKPAIGSGQRRYYYNKQLKILKRIKKFLYEEGYTVAGLQKLLNKRKPDSHKEEDLGIILDLPLQNAEGILEKSTEIEDFIDPKVEIKVGAKIDPNAKLVNFSNIKISAIDPQVREEINQHLYNIRSNLWKLKK